MVGIFIFLYLLLTNANSTTQTIQVAVQTTALAQKYTQIKKEIVTTFPVRLIIPTISVDAEVESVGLTIEGAMDAPKGPQHVGWLNISPNPGDNGNSVIDGHRGWKNNISAVFDRLHELRIGDQIYVKDNNEVSTLFIVRKIRTYAQGEDAEEVFRASTGVHLNLITCDGNWDVSKKSYTKRLVVFADR